MSERHDGQSPPEPIPESELLPWEREAKTPSHEPALNPHPASALPPLPPLPHPDAEGTLPEAGWQQPAPVPPVPPHVPPAAQVPEVQGNRRPSAWVWIAAAIAALALAGGAVWGGISLFGAPAADSPSTPSTADAPTIVSPVDPTTAPDETDPPIEPATNYPLGAPNGVASILFAYDDGNTSLGDEVSFEVSSEGCTRSGFLGNADGDYADLGDEPAAVIVERFSMRGEEAVGPSARYDALDTIVLTDTNGVSVEVLLMMRTHEVDGEEQYSYYAVHPFPDSDSVLIISESCGAEDQGEDAFVAFLTENLRLTVVSSGI